MVRQILTRGDYPMRAISCTAPHELKLIEVPAPALQPGAVRVGIRHVGICGTDYHIFEGNFPYFEFPRIIGHELSGVVLDPNGSPVAKGDPVVINPYLNCGTCPACREGKTNCCETLKVIGVHADGGMADEVVMPAKNLFKAEGISLRDAAMVEFLGIGAHAVRRTELKPGARVLVVGSGPIGLGVAFFARIAGGDVTVIDAAPDKVTATRALGFETYTPAETEAAAFTARKASGFDAVFDCTGVIAVMNQSLFHVRNGGSYTLVGVIKGDLVWPDAEVHRRELTIRASRNGTDEDFLTVMAAMRAGKIPTDRLATHATTLERVSVDLPHWAKARDGLIKAIVTL
jgi:2-desacetyl-2-hydroxyethyl bacteriochlorophyllide A dehydrogenase